jgi:tripartite-type tricarboxylate transporter receptor subunit TctC
MKSSLRQTATPQHRSRPRGCDRPYSKTRSSGQHPRRRFLRLAAGAAALPAISRIASAQTYPTRPVRIVVGFPPGGGNDIFARLIGQSLSERLDRQFIVEDRPGAGGSLATEFVTRAAPDGYTLLLTSSADAWNMALYDNLKFDYLRDIAPVAGIAEGGMVFVVNPSFPAKTVPEFIAYAKNSPGKVGVGSGGVGSGSHLAWTLFTQLSGTSTIHVPYRGEILAISDLLGGQVQAVFPTLASAIEYVRAGKLHALAVTGAARELLLPDVPTLAEFVPEYEVRFWVGIGAPKNTPAAIVEKLNNEISASLADPRLKQRIAELGGTVFMRAPGELGKFVVDWTNGPR